MQIQYVNRTRHALTHSFEMNQLNVIYRRSLLVTLGLSCSGHSQCVFYTELGTNAKSDVINCCIFYVTYISTTNISRPFVSFVHIYHFRRPSVIEYNKAKSRWSCYGNNRTIGNVRYVFRHQLLAAPWLIKAPATRAQIQQ